MQLVHKACPVIFNRAYTQRGDFGYLAAGAALRHPLCDLSFLGSEQGQTGSASLSLHSFVVTLPAESKRRIHAIQQKLRMHRFFNVIESTTAHRLYRGWHIGVASDENDWSVDVSREQLGLKLQPPHHRHAQI